MKSDSSSEQSLPSLFRDRVLGLRRNAFVIFQSFIGQLDGFFKLRIVSADYQVRTLRHFVIRIDAMILHDPFAAVIGGIERELRCRDAAAISQRNCASNADQAAPGASANNRPNFLAAKKPRESVATGSGEFIGDHHFRTVDGDRGPANRLSFSRGENGKKLALKFFGVEVGNLTAGVGAFIDNDAILVELAGQLFIKSDDAGNTGVRHVHVADTAVRSLRNFAAVALDPIEIVRTVLVADGFYRDLPRAGGRRLGVDLETNDFSGEILEISVDVQVSVDFTAVHRDEVIAGFYF